MNNNEILQELRYLYLELKSKEETVKESIKRFNKNEKEIRLLLNLVENKLQNDNSDDGKIYKMIKQAEIKNEFSQKKEFKTSYFQYFIHKQIYKIILHLIISLVLFFIVANLEQNSFFVVTFKMISIGYILFGFIFLLLGAGYRKTNFVIFNNGSYFSTLLNNYNDDKNKEYTIYNSYRFKKIYNVIENTNNIIIIGDIICEKRIEYYFGNSECSTKKLDKVKLPKYFKDNNKLINELKKKIDEE